MKSVNILGTRSAGTVVKSKDPWITNPDFFIFNSSPSDGVSLAYDESKTGLFTYFLCFGLRGS